MGNNDICKAGQRFSDIYPGALEDATTCSEKLMRRDNKLYSVISDCHGGPGGNTICDYVIKENNACEPLKIYDDLLYNAYQARQCAIALNKLSEVTGSRDRFEAKPIKARPIFDAIWKVLKK